jgi:porphobilinogen synthase
MIRTKLRQAIRPRRLRRSSAMRALVREHRIDPEQLVQPLFVVENKDEAGPIASMPGIERFTVEGAVREAMTLDALGLGSVLLFGIPETKDSNASGNYDENGVVQRAVREIKRALPHMVVIADLCNCEYTDHGHCGILNERGDVDNDATVEVLVRTALTYARSGVDMVAPSDMMDGRVRAIREALDGEDFEETAIMAYSAKYASAFYGPFREAAGSTPQFGDRRTYQMDPSNVREAMREMALDAEEGADILMVKPALAYLDLIRDLRENFEHPIAAYNVSGEMSMIEAVAQLGYLDRKRTILETLISMRRAGVDLILTYWATEVAGWL